ncbi:MAG: SpoIIE family protein phosphatase, partial [Caldilineaceae bacterium]|nr:SpoIIE family protein phosphatase [Caldilineaceae bacterium]
LDIVDLLVICSDGFPEASNVAEEMFGYDRLLHAIGDIAGRSAAEIGKYLSEAVAEFVMGHEQSDDQTIIVAKGKE